MKINNSRFIFMLLILIISIDGFCQGEGIHKVGTTSFQFLKVMPDARSTAMGEAFTAVANNSEAVFWNPAALAKVTGFDVSLSYLDWLLDMKHQSFSLAYAVPGVGTVGFMGLMINIGDIQETRVDHLYRDDATGIFNPGLTGRTISPGAIVFGIAFARNLTDKFAFGATAKYAREDLVAHAASAMIFDGGFTYRTGFRSLELASSIRHFGPEIKFLEDGESYPLPQTLTIGVSAYLVSPENSFLLSADDHKLLLAYDMVEARDYGQQYHMGAEYALRDMLFLRCGYKMNYDEEGLALGFGFNVFNTRIDYSYCDFGESLDAVHRFSIGFMKN
jgi:hypothetical protein